MSLNQKKILFYLPSFDAGGAERQALNLAVELKNKHGYLITIASQHKGGPIEEEAIKENINCIEIPFDFYYFKYHKLSITSISKLKAYLKFGIPESL